MPGLEPGIQAAPAVIILRTSALDTRVKPAYDEAEYGALIFGRRLSLDCFAVARNDGILDFFIPWRLLSLQIHIKCIVAATTDRAPVSDRYRFQGNTTAIGPSARRRART